MFGDFLPYEMLIDKRDPCFLDLRFDFLGRATESMVRVLDRHQLGFDISGS